MILDIHTHHPAPQPQAVISVKLEAIANKNEQRKTNNEQLTTQLYSVGIHPWMTEVEIADAVWQEFEELAALPQVVAIGECGIDKLKGGALFKQMQVFKRQIDLSEKLQKPLIIHDVQAHDIIVGLKRDLKPTQKWLIHGFRGKPTVAMMMIRAGIWLSFGPQYNAETLKAISSEYILAETDDSPMTIEEVITSLSATRGEDMTDVVAANTSAFLGRFEV